MLKTLSRTLGLAGLALSLPAMANDECNPLSVITCGVPFPSSYWSVADSSSPTGSTLQVQDNIIRDEVLAQLPAEDGFTPAQLYNGDSGFSAASSVIFEFENRIRVKDVERYGGDQVLAFDITTGQPVDIRAQVSTYARGNNVSAPSNMVEVYPLDRWGFGHQILVAVTKSLPIEGESNDIMSLASRHSAGSRQGQYMAELAEQLARFGINPADLRSATMFTVRDQAEVLEPVQRLLSNTWNSDHEIRNTKVDYLGYADNKLAIVTGELRTDNYRANGLKGGQVDFNKPPVDQWLRFRLTIPKASRVTGKAPVALYAHGLGTNKQTDSLMSEMNAQLGIATFSINFPNHGKRASEDGGQLLNLLHVDHVATVIGMLTQNIFDFASAHKALKSLADMDIVRTRPNRWACWKCSDGIPDIDPSRVFMQGTSLGGVLGSAYATLSPEIMGATYHVPGVGITSILSNSVLWDLMFSRIEPTKATGAEALLLVGAVQQLMDYGDSINYIEYLRNPADGTGPRPLMITVGKDDGIVPNDGTVAMARLLDMPVVGEVRFDVPGVNYQDHYDADGYGMVQFPALLYPVSWLVGDWLTDSSAHLSFVWPRVKKEQREWIKQYILTQ